MWYINNIHKLKCMHSYTLSTKKVIKKTMNLMIIVPFPNNIRMWSNLIQIHINDYAKLISKITDYSWTHVRPAYLLLLQTVNIFLRHKQHIHSKTLMWNWSCDLCKAFKILYYRCLNWKRNWLLIHFGLWSILCFPFEAI